MSDSLVIYKLSPPLKGKGNKKSDVIKGIIFHNKIKNVALVR